MEKQVTEYFDESFSEKRIANDDQVFIPDLIKKVQSRDVVYGQMMNFLNYFHMIDGFNLIIELIKIGSESSCKMPLDWFSYLTSPFRSCK